MPGFVKTKEDERLWAKAKERAKEQGHKDNWAYVTGIYKQMKGGKVGRSGPTAKKAAQAPPDVQKMIGAIFRMLKAAQVAFPGSKFTKKPQVLFRYQPGSLPPRLEGRFVKLDTELRLPQFSGNKARLEFAVHDAYTAFTAERIHHFENGDRPVQADGRYRLLVIPTGFNNRDEWNRMASMLRPFMVAARDNVDRTTKEIATVADKIAAAFSSFSPATGARRVAARYLSRVAGV